MKRVLIIALVILVVISCAYAANDEALSHAASAKVPNGLSKREAEIYRQGYADGYYAAMNPTLTDNTYILNKKSHKFHLPTCNSAAAIMEKNREEYHGSRDALIDAGYSPCGNCNP